MNGSPSRLRGIRAGALLLTALSLLVVLLSAYLRLDGAGLGCADWPACYGKVLTGELPTRDLGIARVLHRAVATASLLLTFYLFWQSRRQPRIKPAAQSATWILLLMLLLSVIGVWSSDPRLVLIGFVNIVGGLGLVSFSWRLVLACESDPRPQSAGVPRLLHLGSAALTLTILFGGLIGAEYAASACATFPDCQGRWWLTTADLAAPQAIAVIPSVGESGAALHLLHRYSALMTLFLFGWIGWQCYSQESLRPAALVLVLLLVGTVLLGALTVSSGFNLSLAVGHDGCAAALLAAVAHLHTQVRRHASCAWRDRE